VETEASARFARAKRGAHDGKSGEPRANAAFDEAKPQVT
jgi:hypothetical protein